jgi:hypothetical protein
MKKSKTFCRKNAETSKLDSSKNLESISNLINRSYAEISSSNHEDEEKSSHTISNTQHLSIKSNRRNRRNQKIRQIRRIQQYKSKIEIC